MDIKKEYLRFPEITKEAGEHYKDLNKLSKFTKKQRRYFFEDRAKTLNKFLELILYTNFPYLSDTQVHYSLFGPFYELMIKLCLLKENWKKYTLDYKKRDNVNFEYAKNQLIFIIKNKKLNEKQMKRIRETLDFIQVQRNNFLHSPFKSYDHYAVQTQLFEVTAILNKIFKLNINDDILYEMLMKVFHYKRNKTGLDFEDVFDEEVGKAFNSLKLREKNLDETIEEKYVNIANTRTEHDDGNFYPKDIKPVNIPFIQYPEPHVLITDLYENPEEWYGIYTIIGDFAEQSFLCYQKGYYHASMACAINCCEYVLKYEYLRKVKRKDAEEFIKTATLGSFVGNNIKNLTKLKIKKRFLKK